MALWNKLMKNSGQLKLYAAAQDQGSLCGPRILGRHSDCWWLFLLIASVWLLASPSFIFCAAWSFELHVLHIWFCKHILMRSQTHCLRVHLSMQAMFLVLIHQVGSSKCMWYFNNINRCFTVFEYLTNSRISKVAQSPSNFQLQTTCRITVQPAFWN